MNSKISSTRVSLFLTITSFLVLHACNTTSSNKKEIDSQPPHIIFLLADDLGYGEPGCYGQEKIETPNIDQIAENGMRFTQFYAGSTVCAPSRGALMTGMHTGHITNRVNYIEKIFQEEGRKVRIPIKPVDTTIAQVLKKGGYRTALFGKWHLEKLTDTMSHPRNKGFDLELFPVIGGTMGGGFYPEGMLKNGKDHYFNENKNGQRNKYIDEIFIDYAIDFLEVNSNDPCFLYISLKTPHAPNVIEDSISYSDRDWPDFARRHAARISKMDAEIGRLVEYLEEKELITNTLLIFTSDNGPHAEGGQDPDFFNSNGPFRGIKRDLLEGGIRVPVVLQWPDVVEKGSESNVIAAFWDFLPTFADIAGLLPPAGIDGISLLPILEGNNINNDRYLYWEFHEEGGKQAVRYNQWKGIRRGISYNRDTSIQLFNLKEDTLEINDVSENYPEVVDKIRKFMNEAHQPYEYSEIDFEMK